MNGFEVPDVTFCTKFSNFLRVLDIHLQSNWAEFVVTG